MGPDGKPWDPARRAQRVAEREQAGVNTAPTASVEATSPSDATKE